MWMWRYSVLKVRYALGVQKTLEHTQDNLQETTENLKQANFAIRERDFVIANQRESGEQSGADEAAFVWGWR